MTRIASFAGSGFDLGALHCAMLAAFAEHVVPLQPDADTFKAALSARGFDPKAAFVAVDDNEVIGFWNVATRSRKRYLIGSETRIDHKGRGLASGLGMAAISAAENVGTESIGRGHRGKHRR